MGSPYLSRNESIILSTNNVIINTVPAEAILTNERLILIDARHTEIRPQDIPFSVIETVTTDENSDLDPMLSLSLVTKPGVTQVLGIVFPQPPKMRRIAERDEWAVRLKELSIISLREGGPRALEILPPWFPGSLPEDATAGAGMAPGSDAESKFRNPPLAPRKLREPPASNNRRAIAATAVVVIVIALAAGAYFFAPSLFGKSEMPLPSVIPAPAETPSIPSPPPPTTIAPPAVTTTATVPVTMVPQATPEVIIPQTGVWVQVKYEGSFNGTAGAPGRFRDIAGTGNHVYQLPIKDEIVSATIQKQDKSGRMLTVEIYNAGKLVRSGSVTAPLGTVNINVDLRTT